MPQLTFCREFPENLPEKVFFKNLNCKLFSMFLTIFGVFRKFSKHFYASFHKIMFHVYRPSCDVVTGGGGGGGVKCQFSKFLSNALLVS